MFIVCMYLFDYLPVKMGIPQSFPCMWVFGKLHVILITSDWVTLLIRKHDSETLGYNFQQNNLEIEITRYI